MQAGFAGERLHLSPSYSHRCNGLKVLPLICFPDLRRCMLEQTPGETQLVSPQRPAASPPKRAA
jgi:hypothetical protein